MSRVSYQAMLEPPDDDTPAYEPLRSTDLPSRRRDADTKLSTKITARQARWLEETARSGGLPTSTVTMAALDLLIALDLDWAALERPRDLRQALVDAVGHRDLRSVDSDG